jgi:hypothetical protein
LNIEVGLISKIEKKEDYLLVINERITKDFFEDHSTVFHAISSHYSKYKTVPERETLQKTFPNFQFYEGEEPLQYFVDKIKEQYKRKLYNSTLPKVAELLPKDVHEAEKILQNLLISSKTAVKTGNIVDGSRIETRIEAYEKREQGLGVDGYSTSWQYLDDLTCGYHPGELIVLMGRAKLGKSWLLVWKMHHIWAEHNVPCVYITKEMGPVAIHWRFDAIHCRLPYDSLRKGQLTLDQKKYYYKKLEEIKEKKNSGEWAEYFVKGFDLTDGSSGVSSFIPAVEQYLSNGGVLFVDGMYLIPDDRGEKDWRGIVNVATDLKILAQTYNIPVIVTTQQSMEDKSDIPQLENAAYGKYIVQYADLIIAGGRSAIEREASRGNIYVLGHREGDVGHFPINMRFDPVDFSQAYDKVVEEDWDEDEEVVDV